MTELDFDNVRTDITLFLEQDKVSNTYMIRIKKLLDYLFFKGRHLIHFSANKYFYY